MRALHQVVTRAAEVRNGIPVFAGTQVPVRALLEHLDAGRELESFLIAHPEVSRPTVNQALALGLEALLRDVPLEPRPKQASLLPRLDAAGVIINAEELRIDQVVGKRVRCPACRMLVFRSWPEGWDGHAGMRCRGLSRGDPDARKTEFKNRFGHLFRLVLWGILALSPGRSLLAQADSAPLRNAAESAQVAFERARRFLLPRYPGGRPTACDERIGRFCYWYEGGSRLPEEPTRAARARDRLIVTLSRAQEELPGDGWIAGQRVRYLVEHGEAEAAVESARACGADPPWCAALLGYALHAAGSFVEAESAFDRALRQMDSAEASRWTSLAPLLEAGREPGAALADTLLWLGDPLWSAPGNDLRTELLSRRVMERLLADAQRPERTRWGPDAAEMLYRYGWPVRWSVDRPGLAGAEVESVVGHERLPSFAFFPVRDGGWVWDPVRDRPRSRYAPAYAETFAPVARHQLATFRREAGVLAVAAFDLSGDTLFSGAGVRASLALGRDPATPPAVGTVDRDGPRGVVISTAPWPASVVSLEVHRPGSNRYARFRAASEPDTGEAFTISDLLLFEAGETLPASLDSVADRALVDLVLDRQKPVGLYWELYDMTGDTVAVSVSVEPARKGLLGRLGQSLGVVSRTQPVRLEWSGAGPGTVLAGRSVELNLGRLDPGRYVIIVEARDGSGRRAVARRPVVLAR